MTKHNLLISIQRIADYLILIKNVILKQSLPAVSTWIREWEWGRKGRKAGWHESRHDWALVKNGCLSILNYIAHLITEEAKLSAHYHITNTGNWCACMTEPICQRGSPPPVQELTGPLERLRLLFNIIHYHNLPITCGGSAKLQETWLSFVKVIQASRQSTNRQTNRIRVRFTCGRPQTGNTCRWQHAFLCFILLKKNAHFHLYIRREWVRWSTDYP